MIVGIPADSYAEFRDAVFPFLRKFEERDLDGWTAEEMEMEILQRKRQVWSINELQAVGMTQITREAVRITHCAGSGVGEWQGAWIDAIEQWASALGKKRVVSLARPGWAKLAKARGWKETHREFAREL